MTAQRRTPNVSLDVRTAVAAPLGGSLTEVAPTSGARAIVDSLDDATELAPGLPRVTGSSIPVAVRTLGSHMPISSRAPQPAPSDIELAPGTRVGEYEIENKIGEGAMGAVYRAVHPTIGRHVAVKIMNPRLCGDAGAVERFTREARSVAAIRHPGIVDVFGFGSLADGRAYLIMEWLDGTSLGARLAHGGLALDEALELLNQIARALAAAHDKGVTHRDLKPDNIFLQYVADDKPIAKILDFGLAKLANDDARIAMTQSGQLLGTPIYMSPEQCKGKGVDHRTDVYALGCIAYELFCGRVPFLADNLAELMAAHLSEQPPSPTSLRSDIPPQLDGLLVAMLGKDSASRPTLSQIRQTIASLRGTEFPTPMPGSLMQLGGQRHDNTPQAATPSLMTVGSLSSSPGGLSTVRPSAHALSTAPSGIQPSGSRRRVIVGGVVGAVVIVGAVVAFAIGGGTSTNKGDVAGSEPSGSDSAVGSTNVATSESQTALVVAADAAPSPAVEPETAAAATMTKESTSTPDAGTKVVPIEKTVTKTPSVRSGAARSVADKASAGAVSAAVNYGTLSIDARPSCNIYVDGKALGSRTPQTALRLSAGRHQLTLVNADLKISDTFSVEVKPDAIVRTFKNYEKKAPEGPTTLNPFAKKKQSASP